MYITFDQLLLGGMFVLTLIDLVIRINKKK